MINYPMYREVGKDNKYLDKFSQREKFYISFNTTRLKLLFLCHIIIMMIIRNTKSKLI